MTEQGSASLISAFMRGARGSGEPSEPPPLDWLSSWSCLDRCGRMMILADRTYVAGDHRAEQALAARKDLRLDHGRLETADPAGGAALRSLLRTDAKVVTTCLPRRGGEGHLMLRAARIGVHRGEPLFGILFWIADDSFAVEWPDFGPIFGFTATEARIVRQLIEGATGDAIAAGMGISINTVRTHISHVYEKLGITCREQLWRRLAPYRID